MLNRAVLGILFLSSTIALAQGGGNATATALLQAQTTLPIVFTKSINADHSRVGDTVSARISQSVRLANGTIVPSGAKITGHVVAARRFVFDKTPYAQQKQSSLSIQFDSLRLGGLNVPLDVTVRAMADPTTSWDARMPNANDTDSSLQTFTQIGGDQLTPSQTELVSIQGDVVAYNRHGGVYAHLISCTGLQVFRLRKQALLPSHQLSRWFRHALLRRCGRAVRRFLKSSAISKTSRRDDLFRIARRRRNHA
jgi:hypothetical protein